MPRLILPAAPQVPTQPSVGNLQDWAASVKAWADTVRGKIEVWSSGVAALNGSQTIQFSVADASSSHQAVSYEQVHGVQGGYLSGSVASGTGTSFVTGASASFTAPCPGLIITSAFVNDDTAASPTVAWKGQVTVNGSVVSADTLGSPSWSFCAANAIAAGSVSVLVQLAANTGTLNTTLFIRGNWAFVPTP